MGGFPKCGSHSLSESTRKIEGDSTVSVLDLDDRMNTLSGEGDIVPCASMGFRFFRDLFNIIKISIHQTTNYPNCQSWTMPLDYLDEAHHQMLFWLKKTWRLLGQLSINTYLPTIWNLDFIFDLL